MWYSALSVPEPRTPYSSRKGCTNASPQLRRMLLISRAIYLYLSQSGYIVISSLADPDAIRLAVDKYLFLG